MRKILLTTVVSFLVTLSGAGLSYAQDGSDVPNLVPIEISVCSYKDRKDSDDYDEAMGMMKKWMEDNDGEPFASFQLNPLYAGNQEFDFVSIGAWASGTSMGKDVAQWSSTAADEIAAIEDAVDCSGATMFTSLNVMQPPGDGSDSFVLIVTDRNDTEAWLKQRK
jgi:hypothetical protein